ncbi:hypothetical protein R1flu_004855 [Riccia fluitans]|uniref:Uncharacterized protein n=1 Tax=Riccia fluitans TaxID=41844 RepID=A0ABD1YRH1_9MARC
MGKKARAVQIAVILLLVVLQELPTSVTQRRYGKCMVEKNPGFLMASYSCVCDPSNSRKDGADGERGKTLLPETDVRYPIFDSISQSCKELRSFFNLARNGRTIFHLRFHQLVLQGAQVILQSVLVQETILYHADRSSLDSLNSCTILSLPLVDDCEAQVWQVIVDFVCDENPVKELSVSIVGDRLGEDGTTSKDASIVEACKKYELATQLCPTLHEAFYNWAIVVSGELRSRGKRRRL